MSEEYGDGGPRIASLATVLVVAAVIVYLGMAVMGASGAQMKEYVQASEEWCDAQGGDLVNSQVIGPHGGLHCELPNGTSVHMWEVVDVEESEPS